MSESTIRAVLIFLWVLLCAGLTGFYGLNGLLGGLVAGTGVVYICFGLSLTAKEPPNE